MQLQLHYTNYTAPQLQLHYTTTTAALHHTTSSSCGWGRPNDHCNHCNHLFFDNSDQLSVHQWIRSAIRDSQQPSSPIGFLFWNFRHRLVRLLLVYIIIYIYTHTFLLYPNYGWQWFLGGPITPIPSTTCSRSSGFGVAPPRQARRRIWRMRTRLVPAWHTGRFWSRIYRIISHVLYMKSNRKQDCCRACETSGSKPLWHPRQQLVDAFDGGCLGLWHGAGHLVRAVSAASARSPGTEVAEMAASLRRYLYQGKWAGMQTPAYHSLPSSLQFEW